MVWAHIFSRSENHKSNITTFPPEKSKRLLLGPGFSGSYCHAADIANIMMIRIVMINRNHREGKSLKTHHCKSTVAQI